ncbi:MAG: anthranilate phosphoribosyltransferase, partial [Deltaproteobacteria bacterium]
VEPVAEALVRLGAERAWVVHGAGGLDEIALEGETVVAEVAEGRVRLGTVTAADAGLAPAPLAALRVGSTAEAAALLGAVLEGTPGPARDVVCLNAAAALVVAGAARDLHEGVGLASASIDSGAATRVLERVVEFTRRQADAGAA